MKGFRFALKITTILLLALSHQAKARYISVLSYQDMLAKSDLVVIADPISKTTDTTERGFFPDLWRQDENGNRSRIKSIGVETEFSVSVVFKGDKGLAQFTLHHYREAPNGDEPPHSVIQSLNGPMLVSFDPSSVSKRSYLVFLVREPDGRFAPTGGQTDPGIKAISPVPFDLH